MNFKTFLLILYAYWLRMLLYDVIGTALAILYSSSRLLRKESGRLHCLYMLTWMWTQYNEVFCWLNFTHLLAVSLSPSLYTHFCCQPLLPFWGISSGSTVLISFLWRLVYSQCYRGSSQMTFWVRPLAMEVTSIGQQGKRENSF